MKIMIVVTHLLGTGHLARALTLGAGFVQAGDSVTVVSGGIPVPHLSAPGARLVQLPPLRSDGVDFARLLGPDGQVADAGHMTARRTALLDTLHDFRPDALITELFPFGRRNLRSEFTALLEAAIALPAPPRIYASIRDILAPPSKPAKAVQTAEVVAQFYDAVLVHSDPRVTPLDVSWPVTPDLAAKLRYTGFVAPAGADRHPDALGAGEIVVSAGGGAVGGSIFSTALAAAALAPQTRWRLLVGGQQAQEEVARLRRGAPLNVTIEPARPEFRQMLHHCAASVSMCGYNTALDILQAGTPAVFVPFDAGSEVEQGLRAETLARLPGIAVLRNADLAPETLGAALEAVRNAPRRAAQSDGFDGAARSVELVHEGRR